MAIRGCSRGCERTSHRSAARTVFDEDALPEAIGKLSRQQPSDQIVNTARFIGHNDPHRPQGIFRGRGAQGEQARSRHDNCGETAWKARIIEFSVNGVAHFEAGVDADDLAADV